MALDGGLLPRMTVKRPCRNVNDTQLYPGQMTGLRSPENLAEVAMAQWPLAITAARLNRRLADQTNGLALILS